MVCLSPNRQHNEIPVFQENNPVSERTVYDAVLLEEKNPKQGKVFRSSPGCRMMKCHSRRRAGEHPVQWFLLQMLIRPDKECRCCLQAREVLDPQVPRNHKPLKTPKSKEAHTVLASQRRLSLSPTLATCNYARAWSLICLSGQLTVTAGANTHGMFSQLWLDSLNAWISVFCLQWCEYSKRPQERHSLFKATELTSGKLIFLTLTCHRCPHSEYPSCTAIPSGYYLDHWYAVLPGQSTRLPGR